MKNKIVINLSENSLTENMLNEFLGNYQMKNYTLVIYGLSDYVPLKNQFKEFDSVLFSDSCSIKLDLLNQLLDFDNVILDPECKIIIKDYVIKWKYLRYQDVFWWKFENLPLNIIKHSYDYTKLKTESIRLLKNKNYLIVSSLGIFSDKSFEFIRYDDLGTNISFSSISLDIIENSDLFYVINSDDLNSTSLSRLEYLESIGYIRKNQSGVIYNITDNSSLIDSEFMKFFDTYEKYSNCHFNK